MDITEEDVEVQHPASQKIELASPDSPVQNSKSPGALNRLRTLEPAVPSDQVLLEEEGCTEEVIGRIQSDALIEADFEDSLVDSPFIMVPSEITLEILRQLSVSDLKSAFLVCRMWGVERHNEALWRSVVLRRYPDHAPLRPIGMSWRMLALAASNNIAELVVEVGAEHLPEDPELAAAKRESMQQHAQQQQHVLGRVVMTRHAPHQNGEYVGQCRGGIPHGVGIMRYEQGNVYFGSWSEGKREGHGEYRWKNGNTYCGEWRDDKQNGQGEFRWNDGDFYKGEWSDDHRHGKGMYTWPKGSFYEGEFHMNDLHNYGRYTWKNGYYEGGWKNSTRHGKGVIKWTNGNSFEGEFANNAKSGYGVYRWSDGATYSGTWEGDDRCGSAVTVWANGMSYIGKYVRDLRNGEGTLRWPNGDTFTGFWKNGGRFGKGVFVEKTTSKTFEQFWREEEKIQYSKGIPPRHPN